IEIGYHDGDPTTFVALSHPGATRTIEPWETPNGMWTQFSLSALVAATDPALGQAIAIRITHQSNGPLLQWQGNYDDLKLFRDTDGDGDSNCMDLDSDNDTCPDVEEAGFTNSGADTLAGIGLNADGTVNSGNLE